MRRGQRDLVRALHAAPIDVDRIGPGLYQGSAPPPGGLLARLGFDAVVLTAVEYQPSAASFPGVIVIRVPLEDDGRPLDRESWREALWAASSVATLVRSGRRVLVTCHMGLNRSGAVTAMALVALTGMTGEDAVARVQSKRWGALSNRAFVRQIRGAWR